MKSLLKNSIKLFFLITLLSKNILACDMSAFEQTEFSERCQRLINYCEKANIAVKVTHPECEKRLSEVSKDWIDFYLSHGKKEVQPPNMCFIPAEIWERNIKKLGNRIFDFLQKKTDAKSFQYIILELSLFKNEEKLTELHKAFKKAHLYETDISKIDNYDVWLDNRIRIPYYYIWNYEEDLPELVSELNMIIEDYIDSINKFKKVLKEDNKSLNTKQRMFDLINKSIDETLDKREQTFYYK